MANALQWVAYDPVPINAGRVYPSLSTYLHINACPLAITLDVDNITGDPSNLNILVRSS